VLVVGAGRGGRSLARELRESPGARVVGFLDDNPRVRRRRVASVTVLGFLDEAEQVLETLSVHEVLVTIPDAPAERVHVVVAACAAAGVECRFVRRELAPAPSPAEVTAER
jgi:FlaA1/EpsC-like NDP-sugar epimerase